MEGSGSPQTIPLIIDVDGTLLHTDVFWEIFWKALQKNPLLIVGGLLKLLIGGIPATKRYLSQKISVDASCLPYNPQVLQLIDKALAGGRPVYLASGSDQIVVDSIIKQLRILSGGFGSDGQINLTGGQKLKLLQEKFGVFDYVGNDKIDLQIFLKSNQAYLVSGDEKLKSRVQHECPSAQFINIRPPSIKIYLKAIRIHQWSKNILVFLPTLMAHRILDTGLIISNLIIFFSLSFVASATYLLNDLTDLDSDRRHPNKKFRPLANGRLSVLKALVLSLLMMFFGLILCWNFTPAFAPLLLGYIILTWAYSRVLKSVPILDVLILSGLYTYRIVAGGLATGISLSSWLLAFSMFFFTGLAFLKRYIELSGLGDGEVTHGRGYRSSDRGLVQQFGIGTGFLSVLVFALYIELGEIGNLYSHPAWLWLICPALLYWIGRIWFLADRGRVNEDPVAFAMTDRSSFVTGLIVLLFMYLAT